MATERAGDDVHIETWWAQRLLLLISAVPLPLLPLLLAWILEANGVHVFATMAILSVLLLGLAAWLLRDFVPTRVAGTSSALEIRKPFKKPETYPLDAVCWRLQSWPPLRYMLRGSYWHQDITICLMDKRGEVLLDGQNKFSARSLDRLVGYLKAHSVEHRPDLPGRRL